MEPDQSAEHEVDGGSHDFERKGDYKKRLINGSIDLCNIFAAFIGSNYLSASYSFKQGGLVFASVMWGLNIVLNHYCCWLIIRSKRTMVTQLLTKFDKTGDQEDETRESRRRKLKRRILNSCQPGHLAEFAFGKLGLWSVEAAVAFTHFVIACVYFIFVADTFLITINDIPYYLEHPQSNFSNFYNNCSTPFFTPYAKGNDPRDSYKMFVCLFVLFVIFSALSMMQAMRKLGILSMIGTIFVLIGTTLLCYMLFDSDLPTCPKKAFNTDYFPVFIGMMVPVFEGVGMMLPIENAMKGNRKAFNLLLGIATYSVGGVVLAFGIVGYYRFHGKTRDIILINFAQESDPYLTLVACICFMIGVVFMYPLQNFPSIQLIEKWFFSRGIGCCNRTTPFSINEEMESNFLIGERRTESVFGLIRNNPNALHDRSCGVTLEIEASPAKRAFLRISLVLLQFAVAIGARHYYGYMFAYFGAIASFFLVFIFPCALQLRLEWFTVSVMVKFVNIFIIVFSVIGAVVAFVGTTVVLAASSAVAT